MNLVAAMLLGACLGSFIATFAKRYEPAPISIVSGRSQCPDCQTVLSVIDLVPILSWLLLRGRCRHCKAGVGYFELAIESVGALLPVVAFLIVDDGQVHWLVCLLGWWLLALAAIDLQTFLLPDWLTISLLMTGLGMAAAGEVGFPTIAQAISGAVGGYVFFRLIAFLYLRLRGRVGLGGGDAKLFAAIGAWVGISHLPLVILIGSCFGLLHAICNGRRSLSTAPVPFGPALSLAGWLVFTGSIESTI